CSNRRTSPTSSLWRPAQTLTVRPWHQVLSSNALKDWVAQTLPRTTTTVGEWIERSYGVSYTRSALIKLLARMDVEDRKPAVIPRKLDPARQQAFIEAYDNLLNNLGDDEAVLFADAV